MGKKEIGTLSVSGTGEVYAQPDIATVRLAVVSQAKTAAQAVQQNADQAKRVIKALERLGVARDDLKTTGLSVYPITRWDEEAERTVIEGYRAENSIAVTVPVELTGQVFDTGIQAGASESSGVTFSLRNPRPYREEALRMAIKDASADARVAARGADVSLLAPRSIDVTEGGAPVFKRVEMMATRDAGTPVLPGELLIAARVYMKFDFFAK